MRRRYTKHDRLSDNPRAFSRSVNPPRCTRQNFRHDGCGKGCADLVQLSEAVTINSQGWGRGQETAPLAVYVMIEIWWFSMERAGKTKKHFSIFSSRFSASSLMPLPLSHIFQNHSEQIVTQGRQLCRQISPIRFQKLMLFFFYVCSRRSPSTL